MQAIDPTFDQVPFDRACDSRSSLIWLLSWGVALAFGAGMEAWVAHARPAAAPQFAALRPAAAASVTERKLANPYGGLVDFLADAGPAAPWPDAPLRASLDDAEPAVAAAENRPNPYGGLVDLFPDARRAAPSAESAALASLEAAPPAAAPIPAPPDVPLPPKRDVARIDDAAPLPPARPAEFASLTPPAQPDRRAPRVAEAAGPAADDRNLFQRLFAPGRPSSAAVATATPDSGPRGAAADRTSGFSIFARSAPPPGYDQWTAVYDISARTVYLPDGSRLEAHSGLGDRLDDPRYVSERGRGATPPALYELGPREELFHGVEALRLTPIGDGDVFGRAGLLAHSYMLGPNGDSNGCVSFKDYDAFLHAFQQGQVKRLAVVAKLD
ncbi:MAG: DUF2778 domain-containing protein [Roseiarcus sp.]|jgi:hypothetical protein